MVTNELMHRLLLVEDVEEHACRCYDAAVSLALDGARLPDWPYNGNPHEIADCLHATVTHGPFSLDWLRDCATALDQPYLANSLPAPFDAVVTDLRFTQLPDERQMRHGGLYLALSLWSYNAARIGPRTDPVNVTLYSSYFEAIENGLDPLLPGIEGVAFGRMVRNLTPRAAVRIVRASLSDAKSEKWWRDEIIAVELRRRQRVITQRLHLALLCSRLRQLLAIRDWGQLRRFVRQDCQVREVTHAGGKRVLKPVGLVQLPLLPQYLEEKAGPAFVPLAAEKSFWRFSRLWPVEAKRLWDLTATSPKPGTNWMQTLDSLVSDFLAEFEPRRAIRGVSVATRQLVDQVERLADFDYPVLLVGEPGSGKDLVALELHRLSRRASQPFEARDASTLVGGDPNTAYADLFGVKGGVITGVSKDQPGVFHVARGGTIFLNELQSYPLLVQGMLLRVIQEKKFRRLGDASGWEDHDARVIAATSREPGTLLDAGLLDPGLYSRLAWGVVRIPPLRERPEDIPVLAEFCLESIAREERLETPTLMPEALEVLLRHKWSTANVRELQGVMARCLLESRGAPIDRSTVEAALVAFQPRVGPEPSRDVLESMRHVGELLYQQVEAGTKIGRLDRLERFYGRPAVAVLLWCWVRDHGHLPNDEEASAIFGYIGTGRRDSAAGNIRVRLHEWGLSRDRLTADAPESLMRMLLRDDSAVTVGT